MASIINASNTGFGGLIETGDSSGTLQLQTVGTNALYIDGSQNVGIGTTTPAYKLQVQASSQNSIYSSTFAYELPIYENVDTKCGKFK